MKNSDTPATPFQEVRGITGGMITKYENHKGLTKREQACINLGIPETGDPELDALIIKSERKRIAAMAMQGLSSACDNSGTWSHDERDVCEKSVSYADTLLDELSK